ncbi:MAG: radical SAM peptide maturase, CXXX-repeat target family [Planctomycetota bacterium]|jgi:radical SAM peptide maturase (CXXX-repeat target family)
MSGIYELGKSLSQYMDGRAQFCTLVLTEQCNLRCKYCYQLGKNAYHRMSPDVALRAIDFFFEMPDPSEGIILEFTGGECTLEIDLMREVIEYFKTQLRQRPRHPWQSAYVLMFSTNGTLYHTEKFQRLLWENRGHSYPAITIDGTKRKHDRARVFADGRGSYDIVARNIKLLLRQYPNSSTKITFSSEDLPYVCESIIHVWELGIQSVAANAVFEDVWKLGDADLYESELRKLADIAIDRGFWKTHRCNLFWEIRPLKPMEQEDDKNWCGTGKMVSVDAKGNLFPCLRFQGFCLANRPPRPLGNIYDGYNEDVLRAFHCLRKSLQSSQKCLECQISDQCAWCTAHNYDAADSDTIFQRVTFICEMHIARWRANQYYWKQLEDRHGIKPRGAESTEQLVGCPI